MILYYFSWFLGSWVDWAQLDWSAPCGTAEDISCSCIQVGTQPSLEHSRWLPIVQNFSICGFSLFCDLLRTFFWHGDWGVFQKYKNGSDKDRLTLEATHHFCLILLDKATPRASSVQRRVNKRGGSKVFLQNPGG